MEAAAIVSIVDLAIGILEKAIPAIESAVQKGETSVETQKAQLDRINAIRTGGFTGPEWQQSTAS